MLPNLVWSVATGLGEGLIDVITSGCLLVTGGRQVVVAGLVVAGGGVNGERGGVVFLVSLFPVGAIAVGKARGILRRELATPAARLVPVPV